MARKKKYWWIAVAVVVIAVAAVAFAAKTRGNGNGEEEKGPDIPNLAAAIDDVQVVVREVGTVEPEVKVDIKSNLSGKVVDLPVRAGDVVKKGQLIARIEPDVNQAQNLLTVRNRGQSRRSTSRTPSRTTRPSGSSSRTASSRSRSTARPRPATARPSRRSMRRAVRSASSRPRASRWATTRARSSTSFRRWTGSSSSVRSSSARR